MNVGRKIREARTEKGMTQEELGRLVGVQKSAVSKWERGETRNIKRSVLKKLSEVLDVSPVSLVMESGEKKGDCEFASDLTECVSLMTDDNRKKVEEYAFRLLREQADAMQQVMGRANRKEEK